MKIRDTELHPHVLRAIKELGYEEETDIQDRCIPEIVKGKDVFGQSSTGSGKTAAFGIPIVQMIHPGKDCKS